MAWAEKLPSGKYRAVYRTKEGKRRAGPDRYTRKSSAEREAARLELETRKPGWRDSSLGLITWGAWVQEWSRARVIENTTRSNEQSMINTWIMPYWGERLLVEVTRHDVQVWANEIARANISNDGSNPKYLATSSVRRVMNVFVSSLTAAVDANVLSVNPAVRIKLPPIPPGRQVYLTREQYAAVVEAVRLESDKAVLDWLVGTGARWGEMAGQHVHTYNPTDGIVTISHTWDGTEIKPYPKGKKQRYVPVLPWVTERLTNSPSSDSCGLHHKEGRCQSGLLFPARKGGARDDRNFSQRVWKPAIRAAGLEDLGPTIHDLRHTFASWLIQAGVPIERVSELLGHSSLSTTQIYAHLAPVKSNDIATALPDPRGANQGQTIKMARVTSLHAVLP